MIIKQARRPLAKRHRYNTTRLAFPRLSCGSQPTTPHPPQAARNRANLLPRIWFRASRDLHEGLDTGHFLPLLRLFCVGSGFFRQRFAPKAAAGDFSTTGPKKVIPIHPQAIHRQSTGIPLALWIAPPGHVVENPLSPYSGPDRTAPATAGVGDARATSASAKATPAPLAVRISRSRRSEDSCMAFLGDRSRPAGPAPRPGRMHQEGPIMKSAQPISNEVLGVWTKPGVI